MEPVSLGASVVALASLLETALDCFKYIRTAKNFGSDYQTCVLRLQNLRLRLSRWGQTVGLDKDPTAPGQPKIGSMSQSEVKQAEVLIRQIIRLFSDTEELAKRYTGMQKESIIVVSADLDGMGDVGRLWPKMDDICLERQKQASLMTKAKWSFFSKDKFVELLGHIHSLIDDLVCLFPANNKTSSQEELCAHEAMQFRGEKALPALHTIALSQDVHLAKAITSLAQDGSTRSTVFNNYDNTRVLNQNETQNIYGGQQVTF